MAELDLSQESSESLIEYIKWKNDPAYEALAKEAFNVFTYRFQPALLKILIPVCLNWGYDKQIATEIAYQTFERVWKYTKFCLSKANKKNPERVILFYLLSIAKHLLADYRKSQTQDPNPFDGSEEIVREFPDLTNIQMAVEKKAELQQKYNIIKKALERLSPKHKPIYLTYKQYEEETKDGYYLPRNLLEKLQKDLELTQTSIRVYKNEAFDKVEEYLQIYGKK